MAARGTDSDYERADPLGSAGVLSGSDLKDIPSWVCYDPVLPSRVTLPQAPSLCYILLNLPAITS